ncbi:hypothetical protein CHELA40_30316 [Chelatococcus asaccharovorans]|nr:hypothetical protein CHELA17_40098 [Chelatococcus asaccharovorans]CAH1688841.1 hypothetical protein CHELA40_30316 [Chelatococcus asaccharovorans]
MRQKTDATKPPAEKVIKDIRRITRKQYGAEEKIRIVLDGLRGDDRRVVSGIVYVIRNGLQWKDAPKGYGPHKMLYNHFIRWSRLVSSIASSPGWPGKGPSRSGS